MIRLLSAALLLSSTAPAMAQVQQAAAPAAPALQSAPQAANTILGSQLIGAMVNGPGNQNIGKVRDIVIGENQRIEAVVAGVGGFLGVGEKDVSLPMRSVTVIRGGDGAPLVTTAFDKAALTAAPAFDPKTPTVGQRVDRAIDTARQSLSPETAPQAQTVTPAPSQQHGYAPNQAQPYGYGYKYGYAQPPQMGYGQAYPQGGYQQYQQPQHGYPSYQQPQNPGSGVYWQAYGRQGYPAAAYGYGAAPATSGSGHAGANGQAQIGGQMGGHAGVSVGGAGSGSGGGGAGMSGQAAGSVGGQAAAGASAGR